MNRERAIKLKMNINLGFVRYVMFRIDRTVEDGLILQWPWWDVQTAFFKGRYCVFSRWTES